jgi:hypothetical protein
MMQYCTQPMLLPDTACSVHTGGNSPPGSCHACVVAVKVEGLPVSFYQQVSSSTAMWHH